MINAIPGTEPTPKILISGLTEGRDVTTYFVAIDKEPATDRNGKSFLRLKLRDASGEVKAIHFDADESVVENLANGDVVEVRGTYSVHEKYGQQFQVRTLRVMAPGEYDIGTLVPVSPVPFDELERRLATLVASVHSPSLHALLTRALDPAREPGATYAIVPAAVRNHHAYRHGLLEHSLIVAEVAGAVAANFATVNRDLTVAGALLHDIGKVHSYSADPMAPGFTDAGRLHGEIVIGHDIVRGLIDEIPGFPGEMAAQLRHIVVSHHGEREKGSPVVPATREAVIVHYCDDMTARLAAVDEIAGRTADGARWSAWCNMLDGYTYLAAASDDAPPAAPSSDQTPDARLAAHAAAAADEATAADAAEAEAQAAAAEAAANDMAEELAAVAAAVSDTAGVLAAIDADEPLPKVADPQLDPASGDHTTGAALF
jgi:3'-5' exoribonuclease